MDSRGLKIISGGQTGADRAALDWAIRHGVPHGGWCPRGRAAEDGPISKCYALRQTQAADYAERTERNVLDSDGTVIFSRRRNLTGGSKLTCDLAVKHGKPVLHLHARSLRPAARLAHFVRQHEIAILNVAGPRASQEPEIAQFVTRVLDEAIACSTQRPP
jgi:hypothetical protein